MAPPSGRGRLAVLLLATLAGSAHAALDQYPFRIATEPASDGHYVFAVNTGEAPVSVRLTLNGDNLGIDQATTQRFVVPARTKRFVAHTYPYDPRRPYRVEHDLLFRVGDEKSQPDQGLLRLPFPEGQEAVVGRSEGRHAVTFELAPGTPVLAARAGKVIDIDERSVILLHGDGTYARYYDVVPAAGLTVGRPLAAGERLASAGEDPVEVAMQRTRAEPEGPTAEALPLPFVAHNPLVTLRLESGQKLTADYTNPYSPPPDPAKAVATAAWVHRDIDRETVLGAYRALHGSAPAAPVAPAPEAALVRGWRLLAAQLTAGARAAAEFLRDPPQARALAAAFIGTLVATAGLVLIWPALRRRRAHGSS